MAPGGHEALPGLQKGLWDGASLREQQRLEDLRIGVLPAFVHPTHIFIQPPFSLLLLALGPPRVKSAALTELS